MKSKEIGYRITIAREEARMTQKDLAEILGISQATLSNYEKGKRRVYLPQLQKIADTLGRPMEYFSPSIDTDLTLDADAGYNETKELLKIMSELSDLPREDRKSVVDYIRWLKSKREE